MDQLLQEKIIARTLRIAIIGLGYVGLPLATMFAEAGFHVTGIDVDQQKVDAANRGVSYIADISSSTLQALIETKQLHFTSDSAVLDDIDAISICVPTPLTDTPLHRMQGVLPSTRRLARWHSCQHVEAICPEAFPLARLFPCAPRYRRNGVLVDARDQLAVRRVLRSLARFYAGSCILLGKHVRAFTRGTSPRNPGNTIQLLNVLEQVYYMKPEMSSVLAWEARSPTQAPNKERLFIPRIHDGGFQARRSVRLGILISPILSLLLNRCAIISIQANLFY